MPICYGYLVICRTNKLFSKSNNNYRKQGGGPIIVRKNQHLVQLTSRHGHHNNKYHQIHHHRSSDTLLGNCGVPTRLKAGGRGDGAGRVTPPLPPHLTNRKSNNTKAVTSSSSTNFSEGVLTTLPSPPEPPSFVVSALVSKS